MRMYIQIFSTVLLSSTCSKQPVSLPPLLSLAPKAGREKWCRKIILWMGMTKGTAMFITLPLVRDKVWMAESSAAAKFARVCR